MGVMVQLVMWVKISKSNPWENQACHICSFHCWYYYFINQNLRFYGSKIWKKFHHLSGLCYANLMSIWNIESLVQTHWEKLWLHQNLIRDFSYTDSTLQCKIPIHKAYYNWKFPLFWSYHINNLLSLFFTSFKNKSTFFVFPFMVVVKIPMSKFH